MIVFWKRGNSWLGGEDAKCVVGECVPVREHV